MRLLVVENDATFAAMLKSAPCIVERAHEIVQITQAVDAIRQIDAGFRFEVALVDLGQSNAERLEALTRLCARCQDLVVIAFSDHRDPDIARDVIRAGAQDCLLKSEATPSIVDRVLLCALERHRREAVLKNAAFYDDLTGVLNRRGARTALCSAIHYASQRELRSCALLTLDLDGFKAVNDKLGHPIGDALLKQCCRRIVGCLRPNDQVGRVGGDEFSVILERIRHNDEASNIAKKLVAVIDSPFQIGRQSVSISASLGVSVYPDDTDSVNDLVEYSDKALYAAKRRGKNQCVTYREMANQPETWQRPPGHDCERVFVNSAARRHSICRLPILADPATDVIRMKSNGSPQ